MIKTLIGLKVIQEFLKLFYFIIMKLNLILIVFYSFTLINDSIKLKIYI